MKNKSHKKLRDYISKDILKSSIGIFLALFVVYCALNYNIVTQFITWCISFFVGGVFTYFVYLLLLVFCFSLIFNKKLKKIKFSFVLLGLIFIFLGTLILITNATAKIKLADGTLTYLSFKEGNFWQSFKESVNGSSEGNYFKVNLSNNTGIIGYTIVAIINTGMSDIGSYVIGSILLCLGLVFTLLKVTIKFIIHIKNYSKRQNFKGIQNEEKYDVAQNIDLSSTNVNKTTELGNSEENFQTHGDKDIDIENNKNKNNEEFYKKSGGFNNTQLIKASIFDEDDFIKKEDMEDNHLNNYEETKKEEPKVIIQKEYIYVDRKSNEIIDEKIGQHNINDNEVDKMSSKENNIYNYDFLNAQQKMKTEEELTDDSNKIEDVKIDKITNEYRNDVAKQGSEDNDDVKTVVKNYIFPSSDLLITRKTGENEAKNEEYAKNCTELINQFCQDFRFEGHIESYQIGPAVTRYDLKVNPGVSASKFNALINDLSSRLGGYQARFQQVVPGRQTSGIEVKNAVVNSVDFKDTFNHLPPLDDIKYKGLMMPFGKDVNGQYINLDFRKFPHMLICGTTGSGKSVFMHTMIMSMIMRNSPENLRLFIIDPKRVEFTKYKDIPHLLGPVCGDPSQANVALQRLVDVMEKRFSYFETIGITDIGEYNSDYIQEHPDVKKMPYIVCVIDEYSNLVSGSVGKDISHSVLILAQKARAVGVHLMVATQAPRTSVITGEIKANFPTAVALLCANSVDSQNIVGVGGAEKLLGNGDMLIKCPLLSTQELVRVQGAFVEPKEIKAVVDFIRARYPHDYDSRFEDLVDHSKDEVVQPLTQQERMEAANDDTYQKIKEYTMNQDYVSISKIQRMFSMGFGRAGKLFQRLISEGIIESSSEPSSNKGSKVLVHSNNFSSLNNNENTSSGSDEVSDLDDFKKPGDEDFI